MLLNIITIAILIIATIIYFRSRSSTSRERWIREAEQYSFDSVLQYVKQTINEMTRTNIDSLALSKEAYDREIFKRSELITALRRCVYGSLQDKQYVKEIIYDILVDSYLDEQSINQIIPFNYINRLSAIDKFDIVLYFYKKQYGKEGFAKLVEKYRLDQAKCDEVDIGKQYFEIDQHDISIIFDQESFYLTREDKFQILTQKIYQQYKGFSVVDELRDMDVDGISGGVSGVVGAVDNIEMLIAQYKQIPYNYDSVWVFYKGKSIHLSCLSFGNINELRRVCQNIYRYNNTGMLSQSKGYKINEMIDGSRIVVVRPNFSESWAFFVRKFNLKRATLDKLITSKNSQLAIGLVRYLAKGGRVTAITGAQGSGKTTLLMAMIGSIYGTLTLRIQEMAFELHLRKLYPKRNILTFKETERISGQMGLDVQKKTDGSVNILGEVASDEVAAWMIQMTQVASLFTIFTHHAKTTKDLILSLRNSLLKCDVFRNEAVAEEQVVSVVEFDIHLNRDYEGRRYIERISEIVPIEPSFELEQNLADKTGEDLTRAFMDNVTGYLKRLSTPQKYQVRDIIRFDGEKYVAVAAPSAHQLTEMYDAMLAQDGAEFKAFVTNNWGRQHAFDELA